MATVNLGRIKPVFRGAWTSGAYVIDDIVTHGNETFICIQAGSNIATTNASYWSKLAAKGTDGTDVGTTLTTQGDILYRDGSGLQRLAKGTAGQALKMNTAANAPEWGTISSDYVKIASGAYSSNVTTLSIDGHFSSDYMNYRLIMNDVLSSTSSGNGLMVRFNNSGSALATTDYTYGFRYVGVAIGGGGNHGDDQSTGSNRIQVTNDMSSAQGSAGHLDIHIWDPLNTDTCKTIRYDNTTTYQNGGGILSQRGMGVYRANQAALTGLTFFWNNSHNFTNFSWKLYGIK